MALFRNPVQRFRRREPPRPPKHFQKQHSDGNTRGIRRELDFLRNTVASSSRRKEFTAEMNLFLEIYTRYLTEKDTRQQITESSDIKSPPSDYMLEYSTSIATDKSALSKLAILRMIGSSDSTEGLASTRPIKDGMSALDLTVQQIEHLNLTENVDIPLILLIPLASKDDILPLLGRWSNKKVNVKLVVQSRFPKLFRDSLLPCAKDVDADNAAWYSISDGDLYGSLSNSGLLDQLIRDGKEVLFISRSENVSACIEGCFLKHMAERRSDFLVEVINKPLPGGEDEFAVVAKGSLSLLKHSAFPSQRPPGSFLASTGNTWMDLKGLKETLSTIGLKLPIIATPAGTVDDRAVVQLTMSAGQAIGLFKKPRLIRVPAERYLAVKTCSDLLLLNSDVYVAHRGQLVVSENRSFKRVPVIKLGERFQNISQFYDRFKGIPSMIELDHLTVTGDVHFGRGIVLRGTVIIIAEEGQRIDIPSGCVLENRLLTGNLVITEL